MRRNIAISGAGIAGLSTAILLARDGHRVTLFEQFEQPHPIGSGLVIQPVGMAVLDLLGIGQNARDLSSQITRMQGYEARNAIRVLDVRYPQGQPGHALHRGTLFTLLWRHVCDMGLNIQTGIRATGTAPEGKQRRLLAEDGRSFGPFDLIIDAAGAGSALTPLRAKPLPYGAIWASVPWPEATPLPRDRLSQCYRGAHHMIGILPIGCLPDDTTPMTAIFWSLPVTSMNEWRSAPLRRWKADATALWPEIQPFLTQITDHSDMTPAIYRHGALPRPYAPGLVHLGDAAHQTSPQLGQGANMALLDALALATALRHETLDNALADYAAMRRAHVWLYQMISASFTPMYQSGSRILPLLRDRLLAPASRLPIIRNMLSRLVAGDLIPPLSGQRFP